ncbi:MAG: hypothetical protein AB7T59_01945 [Hyphomonadaceae bacterium]
MPLARAIPRIVIVLLGAVVSACSNMDLPSGAEFERMPLAVRTGAANTVIERVESSVDRAEVAAAVQRLVTNAPICFPWPGLWLDASTRRNVYYARYDRMSTDWGSEFTAASQARMREFVDMGFLTAVERPDLGPGVVEYQLTAEGDRVLRGSPYGGARPQFCPNAQRRLVEVTNMQWGQFPCGSLHVQFTHVADAYPAWARTEAARQLIDATWSPIGTPISGEVTLSRHWYRPNLLPRGETNGALKSLCLDGAQNVIGDDLDLVAAQ